MSSSNRVATKTSPCGISIYPKYNTPYKGHSGLDNTFPLYLGVHSADLLICLVFWIPSLVYTLWEASGIHLLERNNLHRKIFRIIEHRVIEQKDLIPRETFNEVQWLMEISCICPKRPKPPRRPGCTRRWEWYTDILVSEVQKKKKKKDLWGRGYLSGFTIFIFVF